MEDEKEVEQGKTPAEVMKEMQEAHQKQIDELKKQLEAEKASHAKDVKELLLNGKKSGQTQDTAEAIREKMRKKYYR